MDLFKDTHPHLSEEICENIKTFAAPLSREADNRRFIYTSSFGAILNELEGPLNSQQDE